MSVMEDPKLIETLTRIETKLDQALKEAGDHEVRIRVLEKRVWSIPSGALVIDVVTMIIMYYSMHK